MSEAATAVIAAARAARTAFEDLSNADPDVTDKALRDMAARLIGARSAVLAANGQDLDHAAAAGLTGAVVDRLRLGDERLAAMAGQLRALADAPAIERARAVRELPGGFRLEEHRRPVGVIGANFEARPNVVVDVASQLLKSGNAGVLRTGSAALRSAAALVDSVVTPALADAGLDPAAIQLVRAPGRDAAQELVRRPDLVPLVILRGSGESTRRLTEEAARAGVRTLAHADGGGVLYVDRSADRAAAFGVIESSLDRLGVCNRLNLLLVCADVWAEMIPEILALLARLGVTPSLPPHGHPRGHEWALDTGHEASVTVDTAAGPGEAARIANTETSGIAAAIVTEDRQAATTFLHTYRGTGAFWNTTTRLLDGFTLLGVPETGINVDHVPGPRGPVTYQDLYLRQFVVVPNGGSR
jgi:glutamate-5-semialdehyde dehydrogenase